MAFKDAIKEKVPDYVKGTPEYKVFLSLVKKEDIRGPVSLRKYLDSSIAQHRARIKELQKSNREGTMRRKIKPLEDDLNFLILVKQKILKYL